MESWPVTSPEYRINQEKVAANLEAVRGLMAEHELDGLVVTSADRFQNEYTPLEDNHRYELSGFTGSTALMLIPKDARARLYVDGRYHIQADQEVNHDLIKVVKVQFSVSLSGALFEDIARMGRVGYESDRVTVNLSQVVESKAREAIALPAGRLDEVLGRPELVQTKPLHFIPEDISGRGTPEKLSAVFADIIDGDRAALLLTALDDVAWMSDARGYHFAYQSSFAGTALARPDRLYVSVDKGVADGLEDRAALTFTNDDPVALLRTDAFQSLKVLQFDPGQVNRALIDEIRAARPDLALRESPSPVVSVRAIKTDEEIRHMKACNARSARAIAKTVRWVREQFAAGNTVTEAAYYEAANGFYEGEGARDLSFHTIAAVGSNSAIIHFSNPSEEVVADKNDFMLLDSGALYEGGFATDITRCFVAGGGLAEPSDRQKHVYTVCLKGLLRGMMAEFPKGTKGAFIDALVRDPLYRAGYDFAHGTGHGVGIHVHEPGVGIGPSYQGVIRAGHVCSVEPGIYLEGFGGVRHENVVVFEEHPEREGYLRSRPLNYVGFDAHLVDEGLLNQEELAAYKAYMTVCEERGTSF